jgi:hypothetical protein
MVKNATTVTSRGQSRPPGEIARLIELVNADRELPDVNELINEAHDASRDALQRIFEERIKILSPATREFLGSPRKDLQRFFRQHELLTSARQVLRTIAARYGSNANNLKVYDPRFSADFPISVTVDLVIDKAGRLALSDAPLFSALVGIHADRIRACAVCNRVFWAVRVNSECCSERCRKTHNQRNSRRTRI